jgi:hypothetical protein
MHFFRFSVTALALSLIACGGSSSSPAVSITPVASASIDGAAFESADTMSYKAVVLKDQTREALNIVIAEKASLCAEVNVDRARSRYLMLYVDAKKLAPGVFPLDESTDGPRGSADYRKTDEKCESEEFAYGFGGSGSITVDAVDANHIAGKFDVTIDGRHATGSFDAPLCDLDAAKERLGPEAKRECR